MRNFRHRGALILESINFRDITETVTGIYAEEIGKLELPSTVFRKGVHWKNRFEEIYISIQLDLKDSKF